MRNILVAILLAFGTIGAHSQAVSVADVKDVVVMGQSWRFEVRNPMMDQDPMRDAKMQEERGLAQGRSVTNTNPHRPAILTDSVSGKSAKGRASGSYVYEIKVRNVGTRMVSGLDLEYVFADRETKQEVARLQLSSAGGIGAGKMRTLRFRSIAPPTGSIDAMTAEKGTKNMFLESVIIQSVLYAQK